MNKYFQKLLITTALHETWGREEEIIFLGEWCKKYGQEDLFSHRKHSTYEYHLQDRKKLAIDHEYLSALYERLLTFFASSLNNFHKTDKPLRYWRIIFGPWLLTYLPLMHDRWSSLSKLATLDEDIKTFICEDLNYDRCPNDFKNSNEFFMQDSWNYLVFSEMLHYIDHPKIKLIKLSNDFINLEKDIPITSIGFKSKFFQKIRFLLDIIARFLNYLFFKKSKNLLIIHAYFPESFLFKLCIRLGFLPRSYMEFNKRIKYVDELNRANLNTAFKATNDFERFISSSIIKDIPKAYLENYKDLYKKQRNFTNADLILTANAHFGGELFKVWAAEQIMRGSRLVLSAHGGAFYPKFSVFNHQEKISDVRIVWGKQWLDGQKRLPPNKLSFKVNKIKIDGEVSIVAYDHWRYTSRCVSSPRSSLVLDCHDQLNQLLLSLPNLIFENTKVRFKVFNGTHDAIQRLKDDFSNKIISKRTSMNDLLTNSRIVICTYPQTTFAEAMFSGVPTVMLYIQEYWEVESIYDELIEALKMANIIHTDPSKAANHIQDIYNDPLRWWNSDEVIKARKKFNDICLTESSDPLRDWHLFLSTTI